MTDWSSKQRKSRMDLQEMYFWTNTIKDWNNLLFDDQYKMIIINQLRDQVSKNQVKLYGFVIMPNHIHLLWEMVRQNGKEMPHASFNKATAHLFIKDLKSRGSDSLMQYRVDEKERSHRVWKRDPLAVLMDSQWKFEQKLDYIHDNPLLKESMSIKDPQNYRWSSARFYESGIDEFSFLTHYRDYFG